MRYDIARRVLAGFGVVGALVATTANPAAAEDAKVKLGLYVADTTIAAGSTGTVEVPILYASEPVVLHDVTITFDYSALHGKVTLADVNEQSQDCSPKGTDVLVCTKPYEIETSPWGSGGLFGVAVVPTAAAEDGDEGALKVTFDAAGFSPVSHESRVRIGEGVDLAAADPRSVSAAPGGAFSTPLTVRNVGTTAANGVNAIFFNDYAMRAAKHYSNCTYDGDELRTCQFKESLKAGHSYSATMSYLLGADTYAPGGAFGEVAWMTPAEFEDFTGSVTSRGGSIGKPGTDGALTLAELAGQRAKARGAQADTDPTNNWSYLDVKVTGKNGTDLAAIGDTVTGKAGDVVTATVGFANNGPATLDYSRSGSPITHVDIVVPAGTTAVDVPEECAPLGPGDEQDWEHAGKPGAGKYRCYPDYFIKVGDRQTIEIGLRIDRVTPNAEGTVTINAKCACDGFQDDLNPANDLAKILVNPTDDGGQGGSLPITGSSTAVTVAIGGLLLAAGAVGFVIARRRRTRFVA